MKRKGISLIALCLICSLFLGTISAYADKEIDDAKEEKEKAEKELEEVNATIEELAEEQEGIEAQIEEVNCALVQVLAEIDVIEKQLADKQIEIAAATDAYNEAVITEREQYEAMKVRIKYLYENGDKDIVTLLIESGSIADALVKADYIEKLYEYDRKMLQTYQDTVEQVAILKEQLLKEQEELEILQAQYEEEKTEMESVMLELQAISDDYSQKIVAAKAEAREYAKKIEAQNKEIARLEEEKRKKEEEARRKAEEEARKRAEAQMSESKDTGVVKSTDSKVYDVSSIYSASGSDTGKSLASFACQFIGNPYVAGGTSLTNGADCSGFVYSVYKEYGYTVPRTSYSLRSAGTEVSYADAQPGDVICYTGHVAIYIGNGMIVHASTERTGIKISKAQYREILTVRRIL